MRAPLRAAAERPLWPFVRAAFFAAALRLAAFARAASSQVFFSGMAASCGSSGIRRAVRKKTAARHPMSCNADAIRGMRLPH
ncbi:hypothetical protein [Dokdonella ginsengisoli]|uniref:hypothetical protein n=1 Tax=Dokdonella ginsengisoli TaxID=363846 RepID=UPI0036D36915